MANNTFSIYQGFCVIHPPILKIAQYLPRPSIDIPRVTQPLGSQSL